MQITNFKDMYIAELQELVSMEGQLADVFERSAEAASHPLLKDLLKKQQGDRVRSILEETWGWRDAYGSIHTGIDRGNGKDGEHPSGR